MMNRLREKERASQLVIFAKSIFTNSRLKADSHKNRTKETKDWTFVTVDVLCIPATYNVTEINKMGL